MEQKSTITLKHPTLYEMLARTPLDLTSFRGINHYIPPPHFCKLQARLLAVNNITRTGCCIFIRRDGRLGNLYACNVSGYVEDVLGRWVVNESDAELSEEEILFLILFALICSGYGTHQYLDDDAVMEWVSDEGMDYIAYPSLHDMVKDIDFFDLLAALEEVERGHGKRISEYLDLIYYIRRIPPKSIDINEMKPIFISVEGADGNDIYIDGNPDEDSLIEVIARPVDVYGNISKEKAIALLLKQWSVDGAAMEPTISTNHSNFYGHIAKVMQNEIQHQISTGMLPSADSLGTLRRYQQLSHAFDICNRYLTRTSKFIGVLARANSIDTYKFETPDDIDVSERMLFFDRALRATNVRANPRYNAVMILLATAPSSPEPHAKQKLETLYRRHLYHDGVKHKASFHGYIPSELEQEENSRAILFAFIITINE